MMLGAFHVFTGHLRIFFTYMYIQILCAAMIWVQPLRFSPEKCTYSPLHENCYTVSRGSWPSCYLSVGLRIPLEGMLYSGDFSGHFIYLILFLSTRDFTGFVWGDQRLREVIL